LPGRDRVRDPHRDSALQAERIVREVPSGEGVKRRAWWVRDLIFFALFIGGLIAAWWLLEWAAAWWPSMRYYNRIIVMIGINITLAVSLNIINGHAGQFSLGHAGFMAIGAYTAAFRSFDYCVPYVDKMPEGTGHWVAQNALLLLAVLCGGAFAAIAG